MPRTFDSSLLYLYLGKAAHWTSSQVPGTSIITTSCSTILATR